MIINLNAVLGLQVRKVQSHRPLKMSTLVSSHFLWEKSFAKKFLAQPLWVRHYVCNGEESEASHHGRQSICFSGYDRSNVPK